MRTPLACTDTDGGAQAGAASNGLLETRTLQNGQTIDGSPSKRS
jgi:hypothetical protein